MILSLLFGFIAGIAIGSLFHVTFVSISIFSALAFILFVYRYFVIDKNRLVLTFITLVVVGVLLGIGRMAVSDLYAKSQLDLFAGKPISATGIVVSEPDVREHNTKLTVRLLEIKNSPVEEKILVTVPIYPEYSYGDKIKLNLTLSVPEKIEGEDGRAFDYGGYLRVRGIWFVSNFAKVELIENGHGAYIKTWLFKIKNTFTDAINNALPEPESSLLSGLLLGTKQSLGKELLKEFQRSGVSHVVVLSGYNIAIVANSIMSVLSFLPKAVSFGAGVASIVLFTILAGGGASAWRAAIMVLIARLAKRMSRNYRAGRALGFAVVLMLAPNPLLLVFDPSFQLSVLATVGLIFVSPIVLPYFSWVKEKYGKYIPLREIVSTTIATQVTVLPFLIYNTGLLSLVSLPVNILILGTVPLTMLLGFITGMVGIISLYLSFIPAFFAYILLWYQLTIVHIGATLPFGAINLPAFSPIILILVYFISRRKNEAVLFKSTRSLKCIFVSPEDLVDG